MRKIAAWLLVAVLVCCGLWFQPRGREAESRHASGATLSRSRFRRGGRAVLDLERPETGLVDPLYQPPGQRARRPGGVRWCHGTDMGIASSADGGLTWTYRGTAQGLEFEPGRNTFWAPCLVEHGRTFHMFLAYVRGVPADWSGVFPPYFGLLPAGARRE